MVLAVLEPDVRQFLSVAVYPLAVAALLFCVGLFGVMDFSIPLISFQF